MKVNIDKTRFSKNQQEAYEFLLDMENYRQLMPDETILFEVHESGQGFTVQISKSMPKVGMKIKETTEPSQLVFESPSPNFEYYLTINIDAFDDSNSKISLDFEVMFNIMLDMRSITRIS